LKKTAEIENYLRKVGKLFGEKEGATWMVGDTPFRLKKNEKEKIREIGQALEKFLTCCVEKYWHDVKLRKTVKRGLVSREVIEKLNERSPLLIRPDIVIDSKGIYRIAEIEVDPAGLGIAQALYESYRDSGFKLWPKEAPAEIFAKRMSEPVVFSTFTWRPYAHEQRFFVNRARFFGAEIDFVFVEQWGKLDGSTLVYRLMTPDMVRYIPEIIKNPITPPFFLEWKGWLTFNDGIPEIPKSFLFPLPEEYKREIREFTTSQRKFIIKPVFSSGGKGFIDCQKITTTQWKRIIEDPAKDFLFILQEKIDSQEYSFSVNGKLIDKLKIRLSPFYLLTASGPEVLAVIATLRNSLKVHGATDAIIVPCS
jgi:hypothetical protein